ncbi:hypothetical protein JCM17844_23400 [Iodidimonas gelatinilytica]|uniref:Flp family type IVb pilin n=1 Tax=Iodidimonas gelatinilytica TaxID=1236966 RepID=A0A5A7MTT8_9PROT|nr:Flp family type IVb pilin [Iodidimonas gelatinilytica]GEQ98703.1 hypothetical protein JCM17844_23400 [Iodidimonas gelatinilytica]
MYSHLQIGRFLRDKSGATMMEYGLIIAIMSVVIIAVASLFGAEAIDSFNALSSNMENAESTMSDTPQ